MASHANRVRSSLTTEPATTGARRSGHSGSSSAGAGHPTVRCLHYSRNNNLVAPCCNRIVCCHQGHDDGGRCGKLDLRAVTTVICCSCRAAQPVANACRSCGTSFGLKGCAVCRMWYAGDGFHCRGCGVCRKGKREDWWHCPTCRMCFPLRSAATHSCAASADSCALCKKDMQRSRKPCTTMRCGHMVHCECFVRRVQANYSCPVPSCRKTVVSTTDWVKALDAIAAAEADRNVAAPRKVYCFDCRRKSDARAGQKKCAAHGCGSRNTVRIPASQQHLPFAVPPSMVRR